MLYRGLMVTDLSGSLDGTVASRARGGAYFRERVTPIDPGTPRQQQMRTAMGAGSAYWEGTASQSFRDDWERWASGVRRKNRIGQEYTPTGRQEFLRRWCFRYQSIAVWAPTALQDPSAPTGERSDFADGVAVTLVNPWNVIQVAWDYPQGYEDDGASSFWALYYSVATPATVNFWKGPYRLLGGSKGTGSPTSPVTLTLPFTVAATNKVFWRVRLSRAGFEMGSVHTGNAQRS